MWEIDLGPNPTKEIIIKHAAVAWQENWITSYDYGSVVPITFKSEILKVNLLSSKKFAMFSLYTKHLAEGMNSWTLKNLDPIVRSELTYWEGKGGYCIYLSVLLWCLLYESGLFKEEQVKLVQGYYKHHTHGIFKAFMENPPDQVGLHAWIHAKGYIIDFAINQEACCFNFEDGDYIMGDIPPGMELVGWEEGRSTIKQYARKTAKKSGMTYYQWIQYHTSNAAEVTLKILKDIGEGFTKI